MRKREQEASLLKTDGLPCCGHIRTHTNCILTTPPHNPKHQEEEGVFTAYSLQRCQQQDLSASVCEVCSQHCQLASPEPYRNRDICGAEDASLHGRLWRKPAMSDDNGRKRPFMVLPGLGSGTGEGESRNIYPVILQEPSGRAVGRFQKPRYGHSPISSGPEQRPPCTDTHSSCLHALGLLRPYQRPGDSDALFQWVCCGAE
uniref:Uncharacterized protein n=1 Tax=Knipowitschia caucasica TaxID=637954 RepID=A0AAV2JFZ6_KNICA